MLSRLGLKEVLVMVSVSAITGAFSPAAGVCPGAGPIPEDPNVQWASLPNFLTVCPAGDSVLANHAWRLKGVVFYGDDCNNPRVGVPPESIWVEPLRDSGNVRVNDQPNRIYADDSTNAQGLTTITIPSISGCGKLKLSLFVSGVAYDAPKVYVRSTDCDADQDRRTTPADAAPTVICDLNYSGLADTTDQRIVLNHGTHWHRHVLFGTPIRRTSLCGTCSAESENTLGESDISWSPSGDSIVDCHIFYVASSPKNGNALKGFSFPPFGIHDYDPNWSPLGTEIAFDRGDNTIMRKGVRGANPDTSEKLVWTRCVGFACRGFAMPAISPDGRWIACQRVEDDGRGNLWKVLISDTTQKLR